MSRMSQNGIFLMPPHFYLHVLNNESNITRLEVGPQTFLRKKNETAVGILSPMISVPPQHYCEIENPAVRDAESGEVVVDGNGAVKLRRGESEVRLSQHPFPLYPGEEVKVAVTALPIVKRNHGLRLVARMNVLVEGEEHQAGTEWLFRGPAVYVPCCGVEVVAEQLPTVLQPGHAIRLSASADFLDRGGTNRIAGEEWLCTQSGAFLPDVYEEVVALVAPIVLTDKMAVHLRALSSFKDETGVEHKSGQEWLVTAADRHDHRQYLPGVHEEVMGIVSLTTLTSHQYCVLLDPLDQHNTPQHGRRRLVRGETSFFLRPGERLQQDTVYDVLLLSQNEGVVLRALEDFSDGDKSRRAGDQWLVRGPTELVPPLETEVQAHRCAIQLSSSEGVYVREDTTGHVRCVWGHSYMLSETETLWEKELPVAVEALVTAEKEPQGFRVTRTREHHPASAGRNKTRVVTYQVNRNSALQIYNYRDCSSRVQFGPDLAILGPEEQFTLLNLSGGRPKSANQIKSITLLLGPDFFTDIVIVETADHARLYLQVSYKWYFKLDKERSQESGRKIFSVPDFIGTACKAIASRIRSAVAAVQYDFFHKNSAALIHGSVFGVGEKAVSELLFPHNNLVVTSIDVQSIEPDNQRTRDFLQKSVQLAIEITTNSQEANSRHEAALLEQEARGRLERQGLEDEALVEEGRHRLLVLRADNVAIQVSGQAIAQAQSRAATSLIEAEAALETAKFRAQALRIAAEAESVQIGARRAEKLNYWWRSYALEEAHAQKTLLMETTRFREMVKTIGRDTLVEMSRAGPEADMRLLGSLGIEATLVTDGRGPVNLFQLAHDLVGRAVGAALN